MIKLNHITFTVSDIKKAIHFYNQVFNQMPVATSDNLAYYDLDGIWFALNIERVDKQNTYDHVAFTIDDFEMLKSRLTDANIEYSLGRQRHLDEGTSIYIRDLDKNLLEFHTGTLASRLKYYQNSRKDIQINI